MGGLGDSYWNFVSFSFNHHPKDKLMEGSLIKYSTVKATQGVSYTSIQYHDEKWKFKI